jgi:rod shape determining protein RodA
MKQVISTRPWDNFNWSLFFVVLAIIFIGLINLYSATRLFTTREVFINQIYWLLFGAGVAVLVVSLDYRYYEQYGYIFYGFGVLLLLLVLILGTPIHGAKRWFYFSGFYFQPSEIMKVLLVIGISKYFHQRLKPEGWSPSELLLPSLFMFAPLVLVLQQPDLGTGFLFFLIFISILFLYKLNFRSLFMLIFFVLLLIPLTWFYLLKDYQKERILSFLNPQRDILGVGWQAHQSVIAIGSGRFLGKGFLKGTQNPHLFLTQHHTDFPWAHFSEEWGFLGVCVMLFLYAFLIISSLRIALRAKDRFGGILAFGIAAIFFWHVIINIGMASGLLPVVGITLPFFSYGGSSILANMIGIGLLMNISRRRHIF